MIGPHSSRVMRNSIGTAVNAATCIFVNQGGNGEILMFMLPEPDALLFWCNSGRSYYYHYTATRAGARCLLLALALGPRPRRHRGRRGPPGTVAGSATHYSLPPPPPSLVLGAASAGAEAVSSLVPLWGRGPTSSAGPLISCSTLKESR